MRAATPLLLIVLLAGLPAAPAGASGAPIGDCGHDGDAPLDYRRGIVLSAPVDCEAWFGGADDYRDSFRVEAPPGTTLRVSVTPVDADATGVLFLYTPDHGPGAPPRYEAWAYGALEHASREPGLWIFYAYFCEKGPSCGSIELRYRLVVEVVGAPWPAREWNGSLLLGQPTGRHVNGVLGPSGHDGLDGAWWTLPAKTTGVEFARIAWTGCEGAQCIQVAFTDDAGSAVTGSGACGRRDGEMGCFVPRNATRMFLGARGGVDLRFDVAYWAPAT